MSDRRFDVSGLQITASVLAATTGAILASYLGVAGTIIGTAVMSVAGTAGTAVYKHYLDRTRRRIREAQPVAAAQRAAEWISAGTHTTVPHGAAARRAGQPGAAAAQPTQPGESPGGATPAGTSAGRDEAAGGTAARDLAAGDTDAGRGTEAAGDTGTGRDTELAGVLGAGRDTAAGRETRQEDAAAAARPGWLARCRAAVRGWPRWLQLAAVSAVVFIGVTAAITVVEVAAGKPLQTVVWNHKASGTTVGNLVGGQHAHTTSPASHRAQPSRSASSSPAPSSTGTGSASPSPTPSSGSPSPTTSTSSPPATSSPSPHPTGTARATGTAKASAG